MKYICQPLNNAKKAIIEIIPETEEEKSLLNEMDEDNIDQHTLGFHYSRALELNNRYAALLGIDSFQKFPTKAIISYDVAKGI
ncbi:hypothetical protein [Chryseobacterium sp. 18068]|uniref:hypothetical protein n=1 Tax=Chryseobacterium sp. 18068 TaxID=2681414 RepID=UPI001357E6DF|nr:hypothetical protein [Chryseobacterium sp. 18068]